MEGARGVAARRGYLGLGSNVGDRMGHLRAARDRLAASADVEVTACSSVYETEPQGEAAGQRDFLNACVAIETTLDPEGLLGTCKSVERELGRATGGPRHAPRPIDIDVLLLGELELVTERLALPHPEITERRFVLVPLLELDPGLSLPGGVALVSALEGTGGQRVDAVGSL